MNRQYNYRLPILFMILCIIALGAIIANAKVNFDANDDVIEVEAVSVEKDPGSDLEQTKEYGKVYLYGEIHGKEAVISKELEQWGVYYKENNMRHIFLEIPYFTAELLNLWMKDLINLELDELNFGYSEYGELYINFYNEIKLKYPDTLFHGIDIGLGYDIDGITYRKYLEKAELIDSQEYRKNEETIGQGKEFLKTHDDSYRERMMVKNFLVEYHSLNNEDIMLILGNAHTKLGTLEIDNVKFDTFAQEVTTIIQSEMIISDLSYVLHDTLLTEPIYQEDIFIDKHSCSASYFGRLDNSTNDKIKYIDYWRIDDVPNEVEIDNISNDTVQFYEYPMKLQENMMYCIKATLVDESEMVVYTISTKEKKDGFLVTRVIRFK